MDHIGSKRSEGRRVVSRQILLAASAVRRRPVFKTLPSKGLNQCRQRSTTRRP
ncbi:hypothetical protein [Lapidilactobacillus wuchangensis]|uniref:hypothetical protein n=1 Tax=Lapidilactobacillus wuchangensis TaxID=2486001 RepID=UPI0013DE16BC|nr:hypothetical protein [Lapidilactobacillus wuchangensis]